MLWGSFSLGSSQILRNVILQFCGIILIPNLHLWIDRRKNVLGFPHFFWGLFLWDLPKTLNFILSELMIIFSLSPSPPTHTEKNQHETERRNISPARRPHSTLTRAERMNAGCGFKASGSWIPHALHQEAKLFGFYLDFIIKWWKAIIVPIKGGIFSTLFTAN